MVDQKKKYQARVSVNTLWPKLQKFSNNKAIAKKKKNDNINLLYRDTDVNIKRSNSSGWKLLLRGNLGGWIEVPKGLIFFYCKSCRVVWLLKQFACEALHSLNINYS